MSNQRRERSEAIQGLHQYLMVLYNSYLQEHSESNAKKFVVDIITAQLEYFSQGELQGGDLLQQLEILKDTIVSQANDDIDEDARYRLSEDLEAVTRAIDVTGKYLERK